MLGLNHLLNDTASITVVNGTIIHNQRSNSNEFLMATSDVANLIKKSSYSTFESNDARKVLYQNIPTIIMVVVGYLTMIFSFTLLRKQNKTLFLLSKKINQNWMKTLRALWNFNFCIFSIGALMHALPSYVYQTYFNNNESESSSCSQPPPETFTEGPIGFWFLLYALSKLAQLGNTMFFIFDGENKKVPFLHWFSHSTVLPYVWYMYTSNSSLSPYLVTMDLFVNSCMYGYLTIKDMLFCVDERNTLLLKKLRAHWGSRITMMQFFQLLLSLFFITRTFVNDTIMNRRNNNTNAHDDDHIFFHHTCYESSTSFIVSIGIYLVHLILFVQYVDKKYKCIKKLGMLYYYCSYQLSTKWNNLNSNKKNGDNNSTSGNSGMKPWQQPGLSLSQQFNAASRVVPALAHFATPDDLSYLYARFKQSTCGPVIKTEKDLSEEEVQKILDKQSSEKDKMKWKTWYSARHLTKEQCQLDYVSKVNELSEKAQEQGKQKKKKTKTTSHNDVNTAINNDPMTLYPVQIVSMGAYLPQRIVSNKEIEVKGSMEPGTLDRMRLGVIERRSANTDNGESMVDMAVKAIHDAISKAEPPMQLNDIDLILNASGVASQGIPDDACKVQRELGLGESGIPAFSVHATCLSFMVALDVAGSLMSNGSGKYNNVVIFASVTPVGSEFLHAHDAHTAGLFGDAAVACILRRKTTTTTTPLSSSSCINRSSFETYGVGYELCQIQGGGSYRPPHHKLYVPNDTDKFKMNGPEVVKMISKIGAPSLNNFIPGLQFGLNNLSLDDEDSENNADKDKVFNIDWVVPHQASGLGLETLELLGWPKDKILRTLHKYGNTISASIPLTLYEGIYNTKQIKRGDKVLITGTSAGVSFGCMMLTY